MHKGAVILFALALLATSFLTKLKPALSSSEAIENSWASKAPMKVARAALGVATVNNKIYAIGGSAKDVRLASTEEFLSTNEEYDPETNTWTMKKEMPTPRAAFATATYQNKIYCIGGKTTNGSTAGNGYTAVNEVYDPQTDTWENKTPMPTARGFVTANTVNGKIYVISGSVIGGGTTVNEVYDPATDSWTTKTSMPVYGGYFSTVFDNKIYFMSYEGKSESTLLIYEPATDDWSYGSPKPSDVGFGAMVATTGFLAPKRIYVVGHDYENGAYAVGVYDPENDTWAVGAQKNVTSYRHIRDFGVAIVNDMLYVVGGSISDAFYELYGIGVFTTFSSNVQYTPFGYGSILPEVTVVSPENRIYNSSSLSLIFTVDKPASWSGYSLDGQDNVTVTGNVTLSGLSSGLHNVTVYARDELENTGASETAYFTVELPEPFPVVPVAAASVASVGVIAVGLLVYFKKRHSKSGDKA